MNLNATQDQLRTAVDRALFKLLSERARLVRAGACARPALDDLQRRVDPALLCELEALCTAIETATSPRSTSAPRTAQRSEVLS